MTKQVVCTTGETVGVQELLDQRIMEQLPTAFMDAILGHGSAGVWIEVVEV